jgi:hypothetical protein
MHCLVRIIFMNYDSLNGHPDQSVTRSQIWTEAQLLTQARQADDLSGKTAATVSGVPRRWPFSHIDYRDS